MSHHPTPTTGRGIFDPELLDRCISCGFCLPVCPTYALTSDEGSSPRGRINLMRALETGVLDDDDPRVVEEVSLCLGCRACEPVCPAGVQYGQLLETWRDHQWTGLHRPLLARLLMLAVERTRVLRTIGLVRRHARTAPRRGATTSLMLGCFERGLFPGVSRAAVALLPDLAVPTEQGCCGAMHAHNGESEQAVAMARRLGEQLPGVIVLTAGGCAAHLASVLGRDRVHELGEHLVATGVTPAGEVRVHGRRARVALQDSCHLRNGLGVFAQPRALIAAVADFVPVAGDESCCGSAGTYSLLRPRESARVLRPKLDAIEAAGVDYVVAVNPGCLLQLQIGLRLRRSPVRAVHLAALLSAADGGAPLPNRARSERGAALPRRDRAEVSGRASWRPSRWR